MRTPFVAATAAVALLAGSPAMALDPSYDPVLSTSNSNQNTTSNSNLPLQSRPGGFSDGERASDTGTGMPPHSPGLAPTGPAYPTTSYYPAPAPVYYPTYTYPTTTTYVTPTYVAPPATTVYTTPAVGTTVVGTPVYGTTVVTTPMPVVATTALVGNEVIDVSGVRLGSVTNVDMLRDGQTYAMVYLDPAFGSRTVALPTNRMQYITPGRLMVNATAGQVQQTPSWH